MSPITIDGLGHMDTQKEMPPRLLNIRQSTTHSGESRSTLYKEWKQGNLKFVKMGASTRIEFDELNRYIDAKIKHSA
jgi:excisionase family DNA binding protein